MTSAVTAERTALPLVAVVSRIPLVAEALAPALEAYARVQHFPAERPDTAALLRYLHPEGVVVDNGEDLLAIEPVARDLRFVVLAVDLALRKLRVLDETGAWVDPPDPVPSAEVIRNVIVGHLLARRPLQ